ncbi:ATP-binding protein [Patescibacteria group bacterium]|nr:ATP-binding protein [Patescibacteria group bacterium]MBU4511641.1 ATP-binding protein [Patescibacteria group bacterium]MCG2692711.1 ATP-binding protein [Candidatus Parcubacteria bacterium]
MAFKPTTEQPIKVGEKQEITTTEKLRKEQEGVQVEKETLKAEQAYLQGTAVVRDLIAPTSMQITPHHLELNDKFVRTIFVVTYPRYVAVGWFAPIINLSAPLDISMFFYKIESSYILKKLRNKVGQIEADLAADLDKGAPRDPVKETALRDVEDLRDSLTQGTEYFFRFGLYVTIYANTKEELNTLSRRVEEALGSKLIFTKRALFQVEQGFNSTLPLANDELQIGFNMNTSPCAASFPFVSSDLSSDNGILYGINRHNNSLILFDRFSLQNANAVVLATSGAGKSYAVKLEVLRSMMLGTEVIIIDPEMEYKHLSDAVGGAYINISLNSDSKLNPFDLPRPTGGKIDTASILRSAVITLKGLLKIMIGVRDENGRPDFTPSEDALLDRALLEAYAKVDITAQTNLNQEVNPPVMSDLLDVLESMSGGDDLAARLKKYTEGTFSGLLNSPTNIDAHNQLVVFSVRDLEDELRPMAIYTIVNYIWNIVRSETKKRILTIDEAWWLMQHEDSAKFIFALIKRCRKYYLGVTTITQDINDFLRSPYGQAIVNNSAMQLLLKQSASGIDLIAETFKLTQGERYLLLESGVGEGIFFAGAKHAAIKVVASYTEDQLITSDPRQLLEIEIAKKEFEEEMGAAGGT